MPRHTYVITYDISDDKRRNKVFETLKDHGDHVQYSVFLCDLNPAELASLTAILSPIINHHQDQILLLNLGKSDQSLYNDIRVIGRPYGPPTRSIIV